jgi:plastocyanin
MLVHLIPAGAIIVTALALPALGLSVRAATSTIDQVGQRFSEKSIALKRGDAVVFANRDDVTHNITVLDDDDGSVDLGLQKPGQDLAEEFDKAGRFRVRCTIHPSMKMTVNVK